MSEKLLLVENVNVIAVDWGGGSASMYSQSAANTRLVALEISYLIRHLMEEHGSKVEEFYIIGHSLGSHIAGYAGEDVERRTGRKIGRITGMVSVFLNEYCGRFRIAPDSVDQMKICLEI